MLPGDGLIDQRHTGGPPPPEQDGGNGDALGILPRLVPRGTVGQRAGEPGVGVGGGRGGGGSPRLPAPVDAVLRLVAHALPPHAAVRGQRHVAGGGGGVLPHRGLDMVCMSTKLLGGARLQSNNSTPPSLKMVTIIKEDLFK